MRPSSLKKQSFLCFLGSWRNLQYLLFVNYIFPRWGYSRDNMVWWCIDRLFQLDPCERKKTVAPKTHYTFISQNPKRKEERHLRRLTIFVILVVSFFLSPGGRPNKRTSLSFQELCTVILVRIMVCPGSILYCHST